MAAPRAEWIPFRGRWLYTTTISGAAEAQTRGSIIPTRRVVPLLPGNRGAYGTNDGYGLWMVMPKERGAQVRILAGCRDFTIAQALKHWKGKKNRPHFVPIIKAAREIAKSYGWKI